MTQRERLENKLERRKEWAEKANSRSIAAATSAHNITKDIPLGQPNINGTLTSVLTRSASAMDRACAESAKAEHHEEKAEGLSRMLDNTIFSDDVDAVEQIEKKIEELEKLQEHFKTINKICKSKKLSDVDKLETLKSYKMSENTAKGRIEIGGYESFYLTNNNANIRRYKQRLTEIKARQERQKAAENAKNGVFIEDRGIGYISITFADKPDYRVISALKKAGYYWSCGRWNGKQENMPEAVKEMTK